jgi:hypothetical protein
MKEEVYCKTSLTLGKKMGSIFLAGRDDICILFQQQFLPELNSKVEGVFVERVG